MHPELARGQGPVGDLDVLHRQVHGAGHVAGAPLVVLAHVDEDDGSGRRCFAERGPVGAAVARGQIGAGLHDIGADALDADRGEVGQRGLEQIRGIGEQHDVVGPRHQPADIRGELAGVLDVDRSGQVACGEGLA